MPRSASKESPRRSRVRSVLVRLLPVLILLCGLLMLIAPRLQNLVAYYIKQGSYVEEQRIDLEIAPLFTPEVVYWQEDMLRWAAEYNVDPNLVATIIQIESCGDPQAISSAGALGLMQVMPQHFDTTQNPLDTNTNARRGLDILTECLFSPYNTQRDVGMAFACYNGGPSVLVSQWEFWPQQSRDYYIWGTNIYEDARSGADHSEMLDQWLLAGGASLCTSARENLALATPTP